MLRRRQVFQKFIFSCAGALIASSITAGFASGQQSPDVPPDAKSEEAPPVLLPSPLKISAPKHCEELDGVVRFAAVLDTEGTPHDLKVLDSTDERLVGFATQVAAALRFKPATSDGHPKAVPIELTAGLHTCAQRALHPENGNFYEFSLRAHPMIGIALAAPVPQYPAKKSSAIADIAANDQNDKHVSVPIPTVVVDPNIPLSRKFQVHGICALAITVDENGVPQNLRVARSLSPELDSYAMDAAAHWRFKPALLNGKAPVAFEGTILATFVEIKKEPVAYAIFVPLKPEAVPVKAGKIGKEPLAVPNNTDEVIARYLPHNRIGGLCLISMVVDVNGVPQDVHVVRGVDSSLDTETVSMVEHLRFTEPLTGDGDAPHPVWILMPVHYRLKQSVKDILFAAVNLWIFI